MNNPKVSVGVPVFNGEKFLKKSIESILNQDFKNIEIVISDNCSTDNTSNICLEYASKDKRIKYIRQTENLGSIANFVTVLNQANGQYFMWAGADDMLDKNWISTLLAISENNNSLAFGVTQYIDEFDINIKSTANLRKLSFKGRLWQRKLFFIYTPWLYGKMILCWGLFPRKLLIDITQSSFISKWGGSVDSVWVYSILSKCEVRSTQSVCLYKRVHKNSESYKLEQNFERKFFTRFSRFIVSIFKVNMLSTYITLSPVRLKAIILFSIPFFYPVYVIRSIFAIALYKLNNP